MTDYRGMLRSAADPRLAAFNSKLTPGKSNIIGVRVPEIRRIAKLVVRDDWESFVREEPGSFEEEMLLGIVIATAPVDTVRRTELTDGFLRYVDNWATNDVFCSSWRFPAKDSGIAWDYFAGLMDSGEEFPMRVSLVARMDHFKDEASAGKLLEDIMSHDNGGYYYRMGAAWAVSVCYVRFPEIAKEALASGRMEPWTQNKSVQKIRESLRVPAEDKVYAERFRVPL